MKPHHLGWAVADLYPGYFAFVMATGIDSIVAHEWRMTWVAWALFALNVTGYVGLWALTAVRLVQYPRRVVADFNDHRHGAVFFTAVAATCVLGMQVEVLAEQLTVAMVLWLIGIVLWLGLIYAFFTAATVRAIKPGLEKGINGSWLNVVVATQSVSVLGGVLAPHYAVWRERMQFFCLSMYLLGCMLYIVIIALILYRFLFFTLHPKEFTPPYWIDMGAEAITTLAGAVLIPRMQPSSVLQDFVPFVRGFTLFFWVTGTWWVPLLIILTIWRHAWKRYPLKYNPRYWSLVFPLGMYTACTFEMANAFKLNFLLIIPQCFIYPALLSWLAAFVGMVRSLRHGQLGICD